MMESIVLRKILYTNVKLKHKQSSRWKIIFSQLISNKNAIWLWETTERKVIPCKWVVPNYNTLNTSLLRQGSRRSWLVNKVSMLAS